MQLAQFDKLQQLVKDSADILIRLKFENRNLKKENEQLKQKINNPEYHVSPEISEKLKKLERENGELRDREILFRTRLFNLLTRIKSLSPGVDS
jgi:FtsZ-binding cell division protein ZapB